MFADMAADYGCISACGPLFLPELAMTQYLITGTGSISQSWYTPYERVHDAPCFTSIMCDIYIVAELLLGSAGSVSWVCYHRLAIKA